jgi:hypothetical protein
LNAARFSTGFQEMELDFLAGQFDIFSVGDTECVFKRCNLGRNTGTRSNRGGVGSLSLSNFSGSHYPAIVVLLLLISPVAS